jgi:hypothetical protein
LVGTNVISLTQAKMLDLEDAPPTQLAYFTARNELRNFPYKQKSKLGGRRQ